MSAHDNVCSLRRARFERAIPGNRHRIIFFNQCIVRIFHFRQQIAGSYQSAARLRIQLTQARERLRLVCRAARDRDPVQRARLTRATFGQERIGRDELGIGFGAQDLRIRSDNPCHARSEFDEQDE